MVHSDPCFLVGGRVHFSSKQFFLFFLVFFISFVSLPDTASVRWTSWQSVAVRDINSQLPCCAHLQPSSKRTGFWGTTTSAVISAFDGVQASCRSHGMTRILPDRATASFFPIFISNVFSLLPEKTIWSLTLDFRTIPHHRRRISLL